MRFSFAHEIRDGGVDDQNFERSDAARFVDALKKILCNYPLERFGERGANLILLRGRKDIDDTVDRFGCVGSVQGAENKVAGCGGGQRELNRFKVSHFADENDVRGFAQRATQSVRERAYVNADFAVLTEAV